jgi:ribose-phosphate pyrophosphokinase
MPTLPKTTHPLRIFSGSANRPLAEQVASRLGVQLGRCTTKCLPDSETHVMLDEPVRGDDIYVIQPCCAPVNDHLMELLLYIDAFRRASANTITAVIPYFPYARQERMARGREAISAKVVARMLEAMGASRVIYVDIHAPAIQGFFDIPVDPLTAMPVLAEQFRDEHFRDAVIVAPDEGRVKMAVRYAETLELPVVLLHKRRISFTEAQTMSVVGDLKDKIPIVIDDVISSGTVLTQAPLLLEAGARPEIHLAVTHGMLAPRALQLLDHPAICRLTITNTIPLPPEKQHPKIRVVSIAPLLAAIIQRVHDGSTISDYIRLA